ncbi:MAG: response regulator [Vicinamibacterales bacterium]
MASRNVDVSMAVTGTPVRGPASVEEQLLRIGREAVSNVLRHARATRVQLALEYSASRITLTVRDDGQGFEPGDPGVGTDHFGLTTMRERAESVGGTLTIRIGARRRNDSDRRGAHVMNRTASPISVLLVDDHRIVREGLAMVIDREPDMHVAASAASADDAVRVHRQHHPDVTIMDLQLGGTSGVHAIRQIRHSDPSARIVVLTMMRGDEDIYRAMEAGAVTYLLKDTAIEVSHARNSRRPRRPQPARQPGDQGADRRACRASVSHVTRD